MFNLRAVLRLGQMLVLALFLLLLATLALLGPGVISSAAQTPGRAVVDLAISKSVQPSGVLEPGQRVTYTLVYSNLGTSPATSVTIRDYLPALLLSPTVSSQTPVTPVNSLAGTWQVDDLPPNSRRVLTIAGHVNPTWSTAGTTLLNSVLITAAVSDPNPANNRAQVSSTIGYQLAVQIISPPDGSELQPGLVHFRARASTSANLVRTSLVYTWRLLDAPSSVSGIRLLNQAGPNLLLDLNQAEPGLYRVQVQVSDELGNQALAESEVELQPHPLQVTILGGSPRAVAVGQTLILQGRHTGPADTELAWDLLSVPEGSQAGLDNPLTATLRFVPDVAGLYEFAFQAETADQFAKARVTVEAVSATVPQVAIIAPPGKVDPTRRLVLRAVSPDTATSGLTFTWRVISGDLSLNTDACCTTTAAGELIVPPNTLTPGQAYRLRLDALDAGGNPGYAETVIRSNAPPDGGSLRCLPETGLALRTPFELKALGWEDEDTPLRYQFAYQQAAGLRPVPLATADVDPVLTTLLPPGLLTLTVVVADDLGLRSTAHCQVEVLPPLSNTNLSVSNQPVLSSRLQIEDLRFLEALLMSLDLPPGNSGTLSLLQQERLRQALLTILQRGERRIEMDGLQVFVLEADQQVLANGDAVVSLDEARAQLSLLKRLVTATISITPVDRLAFADFGLGSFIPDPGERVYPTNPYALKVNPDGRLSQPLSFEIVVRDANGELVTDWAALPLILAFDVTEATLNDLRQFQCPRWDEAGQRWGGGGQVLGVRDEPPAVFCQVEHLSEFQLQAESLVGQVALQGRPVAPSTAYQVPLTVTLEGDTLAYQFNPVADAFGRFVLPGVDVSQPYTLTVKNRHTLAVFDQLQAATGSFTFTIGPLPEGDADQNNRVDAADLVLLEDAYNQCGDLAADFNESTCVTAVDLSLLARNFGRQGPVSAASLAPLTSTLTARLVVSPTVIRLSDEPVFTVSLVAQSDAQTFDAARVRLAYDPAALNVLSITRSPVLSTVLVETIDNSSGLFLLEAARLGPTFPSGAQKLTTLRFEVLSDTAPLALQFRTTGGGPTQIFQAGQSILSNLGGGSVVFVSRTAIYLPLVLR